MNESRATRGHGLLEGFLARKRCAMARRLIPRQSGLDSVLDVGCGSFPLFLSGLSARRRVGVDRVGSASVHGVDIVTHDILGDSPLPFEDESFDVVSMLAVIEHIPEGTGARILRDIYRILKCDGVVILTTPAAWTDPILRGMAALRLVSREEIDEHTAAYTTATICNQLCEAGFERTKVKSGTFELGMNLWARGVK